MDGDYNAAVMCVMMSLVRPTYGEREGFGACTNFGAMAQAMLHGWYMGTCQCPAAIENTGFTAACSDIDIPYWTFGSSAGGSN